MSEKKQSQPTTGQTDLEKILKIKLKVTDRETGKSRYCTVAETKTWDWANPEYWRIVNGWQITSYIGLLKMLHLKAEKGLDEVELLEAPRFTMLSGG